MASYKKVTFKPEFDIDNDDDDKVSHLTEVKKKKARFTKKTDKRLLNQFFS